MPNDWADAEARAAARAQPIVDYGSHIAIASVASLLRGAYARGEADALAAHRAAAKPEPEGETVEVRIGLWRGTTIQRLHAEVLLDDDGADHEPHWRRIATIVARVPLPVVPTIEAEVEAP